MLIALRPRESAMAPPSRIRVVVLHHDPLALAGLSAALGAYTDIEVLASETGASGQPTGWCNVPWSADVVVADYAYGMTLASRLAGAPRSSGTPKLLIVSASDREWEIRNAMERGVRGYLLAGCALDDLAQGVRAVHHGARHLSPEVVQRLAESMSAESLTTREEEVLELVVIGLSNKAIAKRLGIAVGTVKTHLRATFDKLRVESRTQAVIAVAKRGLLRGVAPEGGGGAPNRVIPRDPAAHRVAAHVRRVDLEASA